MSWKEPKWPQMSRNELKFSENLNQWCILVYDMIYFTVFQVAYSIWKIKKKNLFFAAHVHKGTLWSPSIYVPSVVSNERLYEVT